MSGALRSAIVRVKRQRDEAACPELGKALVMIWELYKVT
jgi:hypothetical protein